MNITDNKLGFTILPVAVVSIGMILSVAMNTAQAKDKLKHKKKANKTSLHKKPQPSLAKLHYTATDKRQPLPESVLKVLKKYKIPQSDLSIYIRNLNASQALIELNADKIRSPASTMKLLTTYAALKELGPNYSWRTEVWMRGDFNKDNKGILKGDLILKGYGDPFLVYEDFYKLLRSLRDKGLREIQGNVIVDNSYFDLPMHDPAAFDGKPYRIYNAASSALMFNFQATRFLFRPVLDKTAKNDKPGKKKKTGKTGHVEIVAYPAIRQFSFINKVKLTRGKCRKSHYRPVFSKNKQGKLIIKGNYAKRCGQQYILRAVSKPEEHVFNAFAEIWADLKGRHKGGFKWGRIKKGDERFHVYSSPTLGSLMRLINKWSNNVMTRQLFLTLGAKKYGAPGTPEKGKRAVLEILSENDINTDGIVLENGSGLSRKARISARQMASLLEMAYRDPMMPEFMASLSIPGVDGTLVNRFRKDDIRGRSHFKTGTLTGVSAIAGYMLNRQGKWLLIVIQQNGKKTGGGRSRKVQDALLRWSFEQ